MKIRTHYIALILFAIAFVFSSGCNIIEFFKSDKKEVIRTVDKLKVAIYNDDWSKVASRMTNNFRWTTSDNVTFKTIKLKGKKIQEGKIRFKASIDNLPKNRISFALTVDEIKKVNDTKYFTLITSSLKIHRGAADYDNIRWQSQYRWIKKGTEWIISEIKDVSIKKGTRGLTYNTNPVVEKKKKRSRKR